MSTSDVFRFVLPPRPYPGLRPFGKNEWPIFFGRERMIDEVVERLIHQRLLVVHGDSGCGKSSLIRAGVLPRLEQDSARGGAQWLTCVTMPGDEPLGNLASTLATIDGSDDLDERRLRVRRLVNSGRDGAEQLAAYVCGAREQYVCILIDQFEELFAHAHRRGPQQASLLIDLLIGLQQLDAPKLFIVLTMRSEFLGACAQFEGFAEAVNRAQYLLPRMEHADLLRAIREPATLYDGEISSELAQRLIGEARGSQDQLPLIQHGLMLLHREVIKKGSGRWRLGIEDYRAPGGLGQLLSDHADEVAAHVEPAKGDTRVVEDIFRALTDINADGQATRHPQRLKDLIAITGATESEVRRIIDAFRAEGVSFVRPYGSEAVPLDDYIDISHEALIRCWKAIADPRDGWLIREFKNGLVWRSLLVQADSFDRDPSNVLSPATAEERSRWLQRRNPAWSARYGGGWDRVRKLVDASVAERERKIQEDLEARTREERARATALEKARRAKLFRWAFLASLAALMVTVALAVLAYYQREVAIAQRRNADEQRMHAEQKAAEANLTAAYLRESNARTEETANRVQTELAQLKAAAAKTPVNSQIRQQIAQADRSISREVNALSESARLSPRIYVHIADESQRAEASRLKALIEKSKIGDTPILVPGIERVNGPPPHSLLRCFVADECRQYGPQLVALVNAQLGTPKVVLQDFSRTYTPTGAIRPQHFELYFAPGPIVTLSAKAY